MGCTGGNGCIGRHHAHLHNDIAKAEGAAVCAVEDGEATDRI